jgi:hypothetical protein
VVFTEEAELKRHFATEHGGEMNLSRAQRRNLLTVNIQLNYAREQEEAAAAALARPGVVIGGGHNLPRRGGGMRHSRSEGAMAAALAASLESNQVENVMRRSAAEAGAGDPGSVTFNADDFPTVSGRGSGAAPLGTWVGASGGKTSVLQSCRCNTPRCGPSGISFKHDSCAAQLFGGVGQCNVEQGLGRSVWPL